MSWLSEVLVPFVPHADLARVACVSRAWSAKASREWHKRFPWRTQMKPARIYHYLRRAHTLPHRTCLACGAVARKEDSLKVACPCTKRWCSIMLHYHTHCTPPRILRPHCSVVMVYCPLCRESCLALTS